MSTAHLDVQRVCKERGIKTQTANAAALEYLTAEAAAEILGNADVDVPGIAIPYFDAAGNRLPHFARVKLLGAYFPKDKSGQRARKPAKYLQSPGSGNHLYFPRPHDWAQTVNDAAQPIIITEGEFKALAATQEGFPCVAVAGVWNWRSREDDDTSTPIADLYAIAWTGRVVFLIFDSDAAQNEDVRNAREALRIFLWQQGALVYVHDLLSVGGHKVGLDDYLLTEGRKSLRRELDLAVSTPVDPPHDLWAAADVAPRLRRGMLPATLDALAFNTPETLDPTALGFSALAACAIATSDNLRVEVDAGWHERACIWVLPYGPSGAGKTPVNNKAIGPLNAIDAEQEDTYVMRHAAWLGRKKMDKDADPGPEPERKPRLLSSDTTSAAISRILEANEHGIGIVNDEISTVLVSMDNSRDGKSASERGPMCKLYDGGRYSMDRITRSGVAGGPIICKNWSASILGGVTTDKLAVLAKNSVADGMLARCMFVQTPTLAPSSSLGSGDQQTYLTYKDLIRAIYAARPGMLIDVQLSEGARERLGAARRAWMQLAYDVAAELPRYAERVSKATGQAARIALLLMIIEACEAPSRVVKHGAPGERAPQWTDITDTHMQHAVALLDLQLEHDKAFYRMQKGINIGLATALAREVGRWVLRVPITTPFNQRRITHELEAWRSADDRTKRDALSFLHDLNWIGPSKRDWFDYSAKIAHGVHWAVNPQVHTAFRPQAEAARREAEAVKLQMDQNFAARRDAKSAAKGAPC